MDDSATPAAAATQTSPAVRADNNTTTSPPAPAARYRRPSSLFVIIINICLVVVGTGGALLLRVYFIHGGNRMYLSALLQMCGWPLLLPPICVSLFRSRRSHGKQQHGGLAAADLLIPPRLAVAGAVLGAFYAIPSFLYALGSQALPLSTTSLLTAAQLAFTAVAAFFLVGLRFTPFSANAVVLLTIGPAVLAVGSSSGGSGKPAGTYWVGFSETIASTALAGIVLPLVELAMARYGQSRQSRTTVRPSPSPSPPPPTYATVMQMQAVMAAAGTVVCLIGTAISGDFQAVPSEAATFGLGKTNYYLVLIWSAVLWQLLSLGLTGLIICASSLLAGIVTALLVPLSQITAVIFLHEKFDGPKAIALVLSLWGFVSYLYGQKQQAAAQNKMEEAAAQNNNDMHTAGDVEIPNI